jgi:hypothetical protein
MKNNSIKNLNEIEDFSNEIIKNMDQKILDNKNLINLNNDEYSKEIVSKFSNLDDEIQNEIQFDNNNENKNKINENLNNINILIDKFKEDENNKYNQFCETLFNILNSTMNNLTK